MLSLLGIVDMLIGSNIVPVEKKGTKKLRVCIDFRDFNKATPKDEYLMPMADFLVNSASGH
jgi:xanthosine utilization system XapX-like protein